MRQSFDEQLRQLHDDVVHMGSFVVEMLDKAMDALVRQDVALAEEVIRMDDTADAMDIAIETSSMRLLALQQPMSRDLRTIATALKVITDLERIGDYAADIAEIVKPLAGEPYFKPLEDIPLLARLATTMIRNAVQAFVDRDIERALQVCRDDDEVDAVYERVFNDIVHGIERNAQIARQGAYLILVARRLERVADHATNVAERVYYMETGELKHWARMHKEGS
ncbi:MAG: phosphate signaling complex protein PhoU [Abditibacteriales bacterium]|nr:phosphate signaling complex protein PhoU [Abditibacteriales bacterium]MDW8366648.1 phosphate signaling complex protein PhoU [Abditibacteriales bacterium]